MLLAAAASATQVSPKGGVTVLDATLKRPSTSSSNDNNCSSRNKSGPSRSKRIGSSSSSSNGVDGMRDDDVDDDDYGDEAGDHHQGGGASAESAADWSAGAVGRRERLPLDPETVHPSFAGRRALPRHESPASGRAYGLWDPEEVHPAFFGHLRHDGEAAGAAGVAGWNGAGDGGEMDRALRVLRGATDSAAVIGGDGEDGGRGDLAGVVRWSAEDRATVLGFLCEEASMTDAAVKHLEVAYAEAADSGGGFAQYCRSYKLLLFMVLRFENHVWSNSSIVPYRIVLYTVRVYCLNSIRLIFTLYVERLFDDFCSGS